MIVPVSVMAVMAVIKCDRIAESHMQLQHTFWQTCVCVFGGVNSHEKTAIITPHTIGAICSQRKFNQISGSTLEILTWSLRFV
jgi:hypothetical protein